MKRRAFITLLGGAAAAWPLAARAQVYPSRPITIVVPYPAGGPIIRSRVNAGAKIGRPKERAAQGSEV